MEQRKHPMCQVKGCERLQSKKISMEVDLPEHANKELFDDTPFELGLCEMHAGWFENAKDMHISMGCHIRDNYTLHGEEAQDGEHQNKPKCAVDGCDRPQVVIYTMIPTGIMSGKAESINVTGKPVEVRVCAGHARAIAEGEQLKIKLGVWYGEHWDRC